MTRLAGLRLFLGALGAALILHLGREDIMAPLSGAAFSLVYTGQATLIALLVSLAGLYVFLSPLSK